MLPSNHKNLSDLEKLSYDYESFSLKRTMTQGFLQTEFGEIFQAPLLIVLWWLNIVFLYVLMIF